MEAPPFTFWYFGQPVTRCSPTRNHALPHLFADEGRGASGVQQLGASVGLRGFGIPEDEARVVCRLQSGVIFPPTARVNSGRQSARYPPAICSGRKGGQLGGHRFRGCQRWGRGRMLLGVPGALEKSPRVPASLLLLLPCSVFSRPRWIDGRV